MIETLPLPQGEQRAVPRTLNNKGCRAGASVGLLIACVVLAVVALYLATRLHSQGAALADVKALLDRSGSKAQESQANLDKATAQASALQAQLSTDESQRANLQSRLDQSMAQSAGLEAQLTRDQGEESALQAQLDQAKAQTAAIQAQFDRASQEASVFRTELDQARSQVADSTVQLEKAQGDLTRLHPLIVAARQLPLAATFEKSFWDQGFTLHINNPGTAALNLRITISGADKAHVKTAVIEGGATLNVGRLPAGENIVIASDGFDPLNLVAR
jgi:multidrug efflux pump subunit AcrA (membrane-fusion protein)